MTNKYDFLIPDKRFYEELDKADTGDEAIESLLRGKYTIPEEIQLTRWSVERIPDESLRAIEVEWEEIPDIPTIGFDDGSEIELDWNDEFDADLDYTIDPKTYTGSFELDTSKMDAMMKKVSQMQEQKAKQFLAEDDVDEEAIIDELEEQENWDEITREGSEETVDKVLEEETVNCERCGRSFRDDGSEGVEGDHGELYCGINCLNEEYAS